MLIIPERMGTFASTMTLSLAPLDLEYRTSQTGLCVKLHSQLGRRLSAELLMA